VRSILVDAGPLIAMMDRSDKYHRQVKRFLEDFRGRMLTTWPVLAEACHFLPERTQIRFLRWAAQGGLIVMELHETALAEIADWKEKYRDLPMDLADASLLWVAEQTAITDILTIDLRDFSAYRLPNGKSLSPVLQQAPSR
jgi:predicted nucleic acid-binding protein